MLPPVQRRAYVVGQTKKFYKPSIEQSVSGFVQIVPSAEDIDQKVEDIAEQNQKVGLEVQPKNFKMKTYTEGKYTVVYNDYFFKFNDILLAIECCFQLFFVFNAEYPFKS